MGAQLTRYQQNRYYAGNNGALGLFGYTVDLHRSGLLRLPAGPAVEQGTRRGRRHMGTSLVAHGHVRPGRLEGDTDFHRQPRLALGVHAAAVRSGGPPSQHRHLYRQADVRGPERQQPRSLQRLLEAVHAAHRLCVDSGHVPEQDGGTRRIRLHELHGRHGRKSAPDAEPAVLRGNQLHLRCAHARKHYQRLLGCRNVRHPSRHAASALCWRESTVAGSSLGPEPSATDHFAVQRDRWSTNSTRPRPWPPPTSARRAPIWSPRTKPISRWPARGLSLPGPTSTSAGRSSTCLPNVNNIAFTEASATMDYHSLQMSGRRRFSSGLEFLAAYTFGKTLTDNRATTVAASPLVRAPTGRTPTTGAGTAALRSSISRTISRLVVCMTCRLARARSSVPA